MRRRLTAVLPLALLLALLGAGPALAASNFFFVQGTADSPLAACQPVAGVEGYRRCDSVRAAVSAANANVNAEGEADLIYLQAPGLYQLTQTPELTLSDDVTIFGRGPRTTTIQGNGSARVLSVQAGVTAGLYRVAVAGGRAPGGNGGNISNAGSLVMISVRLSGGSALSGGGVASSGLLSISNSLVDNNTAVSSGGGILAVGGASGGLNLHNSTVAFNQLTGSGGQGAGLATSAGVQGSATVIGVTIARNTIQGSGAGAGIAIGSGDQVYIYGSLLANNTVGTSTLSNCAGPGTLSEGGLTTSFEDGSTCGLEYSGQDAQLSAALVDAGGDTDVLTFPPTGFAKGRVTPQCLLGNDQRNAPRAAGGTCDAGAFEEGATAPPIDSGPAFEPVDVQPPPVPNPGPPPVATPVPTPEYRETVVVRPVSGTVRICARRLDQCTVLAAGQAIPLGASVDTKRGVVELASVPKAGAPPEKAKFRDGIFKVTQTGSTTDLTLNEPLAACKKASAAAAKPKSRKLWGDGKGKFRTRGRYSAATVRGTEWLVQDSCAGTLTRVKTGSVNVRDNVKKKTVLVRAGKKYLARPKR